VNRLGPDLLASLGLHVVLGVAVLSFGTCQGEAPAPLFRPDEIIMVEMAGPAQNLTRMPQKAERAPDSLPEPPVEAAAEADAPEPPAPAAAPDELVLRERKEEAKKQKEAEDKARAEAKAAEAKASADAKAKADADKRRADLDREMRRRRLIEGLEDAPVGKVDRAASSPDGGEQATGVTGAGTQDPGLARWSDGARQRVQPNWTPLRATCKPGLMTLILVGVDAQGKVVRAPTIHQPSGNTGFDQAALRAVNAATTLPAPPAKYAKGLNGLIQFSSKECP
jgi:TolA protein